MFRNGDEKYFFKIRLLLLIKFDGSAIKKESWPPIRDRASCLGLMQLDPCTQTINTEDNALKVQSIVYLQCNIAD